MEAVLFGLSRDAKTESAITMLHDSRKLFSFTDVKSTSSNLMEAVSAMTNSNELPVLAHKGVIYVGLESIQRYCRT